MRATNFGFYRFPRIGVPRVPGHDRFMFSGTNRTRGYRQLRKGRVSERNRIYHVVSRTFRSVPVFGSFVDARLLIRAMRDPYLAGHLDSLAFVVMPDHFHWLMQLQGERSLASCINLVKSLAAREIHTHGEYRGRIWQRGFYDRALRKEDDLAAAARYIVANPLRAGLVESIREYPHWHARWI